MNKSEKDHLSNVASIGCIVCLNQGNEGTPAEIHHIRHGNGMSQRASNYEAIPLCHIHHRTGGYGMAIHAGRKEFERLYGTEIELLEQIRGLING